MLKIEIEVEKCLEIIEQQKELIKCQCLTDCFVGTDQMEIDTNFLIEKNILEKRNGFYFLKENYKDIIKREKILNNPVIKRVRQISFIFSPITDMIKDTKNILK